jgi:phosphoglycerate dehydrogenase-like enzyme
MKILVTLPKGYVFDTFFPAEQMERLEKIGEVKWNQTERQYTREELKGLLQETDICITGWGCPKIEGDMVENAKRLKLIAHDAGTVGPYIALEVFDQGIRVCTGNRMFAESVAESVIAYSLASLRKIPQYDSALHGDLLWKETNFHNSGLLEKTVGIISYGMIAQELIKLLRPFHCKILVDSEFVTQQQLDEYGMDIQKASMEEIFRICDVVSIHSTLIPENYHSIDKALLSTMKAGALLVNTSRGAILDEAALAEVLAEGKIKAALDVFETEPLPLDSPLRKLSNVLLIPHMGGPTIDRRMAVTRYVIDDIEHFLKGEPLLGEVDREYASHMTDPTKMPVGAKS